ncbi:short-chain dehydrogenase [Fusarium heterosporum]|uniref:Short-chain dehydrogenase n=1 Tax=Fusarium heterosporum TaxID=42747 RepID=A0A8H5U434_FUSHE|nr:short-chain dehydrogenase [Fusarium heterosporum]
MTPPTVLIFGAGAKTGMAIANAFHSKGYKLALASRSQDPATSTEDELHIPTDCSDTDSILQAFEQTRNVFGHPTVVIYNAYDGPKSSPTDVFDLPLEDFKKSTIVNILSAYAAAQQAIQGWKELPASSKPTFIYTGNCENVAPIPLLMALGVGKAGAASFIEVAANAYKDKGYKFYYADERLEDGSPMWNGATAEGHAALYLELAEGDEQLEWQQTFVTGVGYIKLPVPEF